MKDQELRVTVTDSEADTRLDKFLAGMTQIQSRSRAEQLIDKNLVWVNSKLQKSSYKVKAFDQIVVQIPQEIPTSLQPYHLDLEILFEDEDLLVVNKPAGLVVHPAAGHEQDTLVNALVAHTSDFAMKFGEKRPGIVHRLDKETSGLLVVAKNDFTQENLSLQFKNRTIQRIYHATCFGIIPWDQGWIESTLARHPVHRKKFSSIPGTFKTSFYRQMTKVIEDQNSLSGKWAKTHFKKIRTKGDLTDLEVRLETGRTHQIRVHFFELGFPLAGDTIYFSKKSKEAQIFLGLKAVTLGFVHPRNGEPMSFSLI